MLDLVTVWLALTSLAYASAISHVRPLVVWHGLGDSYASHGMVQFENDVKKMHPGIFVHSVYIDRDAQADQRAAFYGNVDEQLAFVAEQLSSVPELGGGFDAIGFSQGGQFLRAYVERNNTPPVHNLITFGSQHMGISDLPACSPFDLLCQAARLAVKAGVYTKWAQENLVQAQYFRDPVQLSLYMSSGSFLADINNEVLSSARKQAYAENLASLQHLVLVLFAKDATVVPKESAWFGSEAPPEKDMRYGPDRFPEQERLGSHVQKTIVPMKLQPLYTEDWIGLRTLDERGAVILVTCPGRHMQLTGCWENLAQKWIGGLI